jgi:galactokinase
MSFDLAADLFRRTFGNDPELLATAPGRVNLIGEHTDYNDGFVFPCAIDLGVYLALSRSEGPSRLVSQEVGEGQPFETTTVEPGDVNPEIAGDWTKYPAGMAWAFRQEGVLVDNVIGALVSTVPIGSGVSSSAAVEMAFAVAWRQMHGLPHTASMLARLGQICENRFVGVNSGIMDQMASANGVAGHAMFLDTRSLEIRQAPIPQELAIVLMDTGKPRALTTSAYNERRSQCESVARALGVPALRDADMTALDSAEHRLDKVAYRRARHVITENARCERFAEALTAKDLSEIGALMRASHESLRDDYEVSCAELDAMAESAWAAPGCVGARMTGAGFGGACVALVERAQVDAFRSKALESYRVRATPPGAITVCQAVDGANVKISR